MQLGVTKRDKPFKAVKKDGVPCPGADKFNCGKNLHEARLGKEAGKN